MSEYIKREDAIKALTDCPVQYVSRICNVPSADVVEVVRCKDCARRNKDCPLQVWCGPLDDDYCSRGVPKK